MFSPHCCGFYSFTGMIFMSFVYVVLATQPFFISGIDDIEEARTSALGALITFGSLFVACVFLICMNKNAAGRDNDAADEDDHGRLNIDMTYEPRTAESIRRGGKEGVDVAVHEIS
ncbi:hypothetical protein ACHAW5_010521 [Stephanodiscus triporus]|uniref:Uncharacterized protein n=1 Tax=Stephanodiscus triporus TaxID=2934178 RepID=A0ABD3NWV3_9STRA